MKSEETTDMNSNTEEIIQKLVKETKEDD